MKNASLIGVERVAVIAMKASNGLAPWVHLCARLYVARVFFLAGFSKVTDGATTLDLFVTEYHVPLLPPLVAAVLATVSELAFSTLLALGLFTRLAATALFLVNTVAVISYYPTLMSSPAAIHDHLEWGLILALCATAPAGALAIDRWVFRTRIP